MAERYAELLDDVAAKVARMARCGLPPMGEAQAKDACTGNLRGITFRSLRTGTG